MHPGFTWDKIRKELFWVLDNPRERGGGLKLNKKYWDKKMGFNKFLGTKKFFGQKRIQVKRILDNKILGQKQLSLLVVYMITFSLSQHNPLVILPA